MLACNSMASEQRHQLPLALTLVISWGVFTAGLILALSVMKFRIPGSIAKVLPFILAGFVTGRLCPVASRRSKVIALGMLAMVSAAAWSVFAGMTSNIETKEILILFATAIPVMAVASLWAYFGIYLGSSSRQSEPEADDLEEELRDEIASESNG